ncbi:unnamed protein product [Pleuronectes platessa]|uniref:Uncharacterized protein n=1 Tax=Pleuronectes platessa TaxID=8262 RepID=A0A9N7VQS7_PLEPL|nr:unnamed protein product [Pleuronectes platessa]
MKANARRLQMKPWASFTAADMLNTPGATLTLHDTVGSLGQSVSKTSAPPPPVFEPVSLHQDHLLLATCSRVTSGLKDSHTIASPTWPPAEHRRHRRTIMVKCVSQTR